MSKNADEIRYQSLIEVNARRAYDKIVPRRRYQSLIEVNARKFGERKLNDRVFSINPL